MGKSVAIAHLASIFVTDPPLLIDDADQDKILALEDQRVIYSTRWRLRTTPFSYTLARWSEDDLIELLLAIAPERCASVMSRVAQAADKSLLAGQPELCDVVARQMVASDSVSDCRAAIGRAIGALTSDDKTKNDARKYALFATIGEEMATWKHAARLRESSRMLSNLLHHQAVRNLLAAEEMVARLARASEGPLLRRELPLILSKEIARLVPTSDSATERLLKLVSGLDDHSAPAAATILHHSETGWKPDCRKCSEYFGADFAGAKWRGLELFAANLSRADLSRADLRDVDLRQATLVKARCRSSDLRGARLTDVNATLADFSTARLGKAKMAAGNFFQASFEDAILEGVDASGAKFRRTNFADASLRSACLTECDFHRAILEGAILDDADLQAACLNGLDLRHVSLDGADLSHAKLRNCNLELVFFSHAKLRYADLTGALLTGSVMPQADLYNACLQQAGLADVEWEKADLRGVNFSGCSFHLGSTRSGLVGSPYPCHGSRTGFYTNDYDAQDYKPPEEIRKANLCDADLRGASVRDADFYLVDLRGAKYDESQKSHFLRCDAILYDRVP